MSRPLVLCYRAVSEGWDLDLAVRPAQLEAQLGRLIRRGYRGATFHDALTRPVPGKTLVVTFDGGFRSIYELALPVLAALGIPGTVFVPTGYIREGGRGGLAGARGLGRRVARGRALAGLLGRAASPARAGLGGRCARPLPFPPDGTRGRRAGGGASGLQGRLRDGPESSVPVALLPVRRRRPQGRRSGQSRRLRDRRGPSCHVCAAGPDEVATSRDRPGRRQASVRAEARRRATESAPHGPCRPPPGQIRECRSGPVRAWSPSSEEGAATERPPRGSR